MKRLLSILLLFLGSLAGYSFAQGTISGTGTLSGSGAISICNGCGSGNTQVLPPTFSPVAGSYSATQNVALADGTAGATICWNIGSPPSTNGQGVCVTGLPYTAAIPVTVSETIYAIGTKAGSFVDSVLSSAAYTISQSFTDNDAYELCGNTANFGGTDGPATLPTSGYSTNLSCTQNQSPAGQLQADIANGASAAAIQTVLTNAVCGEVIKFAAGAVVTLAASSVTLPAKGCTDGHYIQITVDTTHLPPEKQRATPCWWGVASLPGRPSFGNTVGGGSPCSTVYGAEIQQTNTGGPVFVVASGATHYRIGPGLKFTNSSGTIISNLWNMLQSDHITFDRDWFAGGASVETTRGIIFGNANNIAIVDSFFSDFHCLARLGSCTDAQAFSGGLCSDATCGTYKIVDNYLEGSGECYIFGGGVSSATPTDIEIRRNWCNLPQTWNPSSPTYNGGVSGQPWIVKNLGEFKNGNRALIEGNVRTNVWCEADQVGYAALITPKAYDATPSHYAVTNVTERWERFDTTEGGISIANQDSDSGLVSSAGNSYSIHDLLGTNLGYSTAFGCGSRGFEMTLGSSNLGYSGYTLHDVTIRHLTMVGNAAGTGHSFLVNGPTSLNPPLNNNLTFTDSIWFDAATSGAGGYAKPLGMIQRASNTVTAVLQDIHTVSRAFRVGAVGTVTGVSGDSTFNSCGAAPCASGNFTIATWDGSSTLTWPQTDPDSGPFANQGTFGVYGCDFNNQASPGLFTGCFTGLSFTNNVIYGPSRTWPGTFFTPASGALVGFTSYTGDSTGNYQLLPSSAYHNAALDSTDIGVSSVPTLTAYTLGVDTLP